MIFFFFLLESVYKKRKRADIVGLLSMLLAALGSGWLSGFQHRGVLEAWGNESDSALTMFMSPGPPDPPFKCASHP